MTAASKRQKEKQIKTKHSSNFQIQFPVLGFSIVISSNLFEETTPGQGILIAGIINLKRGERKNREFVFQSQNGSKETFLGQGAVVKIVLKKGKSLQRIIYNSVLNLSFSFSTPRQKYSVTDYDYHTRT